jgi:cell division septation protein DedD
MKNFNKRTLIVTSLTLFSLNSSMAQNPSTWEKKESRNQEDCVNCYADIDSDKKAVELLKSEEVVDKRAEVYSYNDTVSTSKTYYKDGYEYEVSASDSYSDSTNKAIVISDEEDIEKIAPPISADNIKKIAIQVGAFRRYAGAKIYAKKYAILSSKYNVEIETGIKDQKPIYRVRIEGFSSRSKAKEFKRKYGLTGAFLVMR